MDDSIDYGFGMVKQIEKIGFGEIEKGELQGEMILHIQTPDGEEHNFVLTPLTAIGLLAGVSEGLQRVVDKAYG